MDEAKKTVRRWRRALGIARILFEQEGYHCAYLDEIEEALTQARIRPEQVRFWLWLKTHHGPIVRSDMERHGIEFITTRKRVHAVSRRYPCPTAVDVGAGVFGVYAGMLFIDDEDGRAVAYAPPELRRGPRLHCERWQIRGREMARVLSELAPLNDSTALELLQGAVAEGWVTETDVGIAKRAAACGR